MPWLLSAVAVRRKESCAIYYFLAVIVIAIAVLLVALILFVVVAAPKPPLHSCAERLLLTVEPPFWAGDWGGRFRLFIPGPTRRAKICSARTCEKYLNYGCRGILRSSLPNNRSHSYAWMYVCMHACMCIYIYIYTHTYESLCVYTYVYIYIYIYTHMYINRINLYIGTVGIIIVYILIRLRPRMS